MRDEFSYYAYGNQNTEDTRKKRITMSIEELDAILGALARVEDCILYNRPSSLTMISLDKAQELLCAKANSLIA